MHKALVLISGPDDGSSDDTISREDLTGCRLIVSQRGSLMRALVADVLASGIDVSVVAEIAHRTSILPMVLNGLGRAVLPASWTASARRSGARVQTITPESYLHVAAVSRRTHLTTPATALMIEARAYAAQAARQTSGPHGGDQPVAASVNEPHHRDICAVAVLTDNDAAFTGAPRRGGRTALENHPGHRRHQVFDLTALSPADLRKSGPHPPNAKEMAHSPPITGTDSWSMFGCR